MYKIEIYYFTIVGDVFSTMNTWTWRVTYQEVGLGENLRDFYVKKERIERKNDPVK